MTWLIAPIGLILTVFLLLQQIALWQRKEYRWDRLRADLPASIIQLVTWRIRRPQFTLKVLVIVGASLVLLGLLYWFFASFITLDSIRWLLLIVATPVVVPLALGMANIIGNVQKERLQRQAREARGRYPHLTVIGITGSYGKTSTKYFLHHVLSGADRVVHMTADRRNEAYVVADDLLRNVTEATDTYIVEMGAYRAGEIKKIVDIVQPRIGVVTAIGNQHMALFGSLEKLAAAKWELVQALPSDGTAVLNADDVTIKKRATGFKGRIIWYSRTEPVDVYTERIDYEAMSSRLVLHIGTEKASVTLPLPGDGYVSAAVAAAAAAFALGLPATTIFGRLATLSPIPQTMVITKNSQGSTIIDDSYSANEQGVLMALRHLELFAMPRRVVVLRPLIELGSDTTRVHRAIGTALARLNAIVYLYDLPGAADIEHAAREAGLTAPLHRLASPKALADEVSEALDENTVCLLENRLPDIVRQTTLQ